MTNEFEIANNFSYRGNITDISPCVQDILIKHML